MSRLLRCYPRWWRNRYGSEMSELLAGSSHQWRDRLNVVAGAALVWAGMPAVAVIVLSVSAAALVLFGFSVGQLADGVSDIPAHWWSTASALFAMMTLVASTAVVMSLRPTTINRRGGT